MFFYWLQFAQTETARYIVVGMIYLTHLVTAITTDHCQIWRRASWLPNDDLMKWYRWHGIPWGVWLIVDTVEVAEDIYAMVALWRRMNFFEAGYFLGKMPVNTAFYSMGLFFSSIYWYRKNKKETDGDGSDTNGDSLFVIAL